MATSNVQYKETISSVQSDVLNQTYIGALILAIPVMITSYMRLPILGISPIIYMTIIGSIIISFVYYFRRRISYRIRIYVILATGYAIGVADLLSIGMLSFGASILLSIFAFSALFLKRKQLIGFGVLNLVTFTLFGILIQLRILTYSFDIGMYFYNGPAWNAQIVTFTMFSFALIFAISKLIEYTHQSALMLQSQNEELVGLSSQLLSTETELRQKIIELENNRMYLRDSEKKYRTLIENSMDAVYAIDMAGRFTSINRQFEEIIGIAREDVIGKKYGELIDDEVVVKAYEELINRVLATGNKSSQINTIVDQEGHKKTYESTVVPVKNNEGEVELLIATNHDLTTIIEKRRSHSQII